MKKRWMSGFTVAAAVALVACGSGDGSQSSSSDPSHSGVPASEADDVDPNGILKFGQDMQQSAGIHFDPTEYRAISGIGHLELVYGTLMRESIEQPGTFEPYMAEAVEVVDPQTVRITLRPDVVFTDGAPYDAEAVKLSIERQRFEHKNESGIHQGLLPLTAIEVIDPLTVEATLDRPVAGLFIESLASHPGLIHSPTQLTEAPETIDTRPIGAGPFTVDEFVAEQSIAFRKNPQFWDAATWKLGGIDFVHTPPGTPQANGLLSGTIDYSTRVPVGSVDAIRANSDFSVDLVPVRFNTLLLCATKPPFDDERVRQALSLAIDREAYDELVYGGDGEPAYGIFPEDHPSFDPAVKEMLTYDPDRARELIAESGATDLSFEMVLVPSNAFDRNAEVLQSQLQQVGFDVTIQPYENVYTDWIEPQKPGALLAYQNGQPNGGWIHFAKLFEKGGSNAFCGVEDAEVMDLVNEAVQYPADSPESIEAFRQANLLYAEHAISIPIDFDPVVNVWNSAKVGGTPAYRTDTADARVRLETLYIKE